MKTLLRAAVATAFILIPPAASAEDWNNEAIALQTRGDWNGLRNLADRWTKAEPRNFAAWADLGVAYDFLKRPDQAVAAYERSLELQPQSSVWMQLSADYHALHQTEKLQALYGRLQKTNPQYAAMLMTQYAQDLHPAPKGPPQVPSDVPGLASAALKEARQWKPDAALTLIQAENYSGREFDIALTFVSLKARQVMTMVGSQYGGLISALAGNTSTAPLPDRFIDLPRAVATARQGGMQGPVSRAILCVWHEASRQAVTAWVITPANVAVSRVFNIDAVTGASYRASDLFGPMPANDQQLRDAIQRVKDTFAPPPPAPSSVGGGRPAALCGWCASQNMNYSRWQSDYYLHNNFPPPK